MMKIAGGLFRWKSGRDFFISHVCPWEKQEQELQGARNISTCQGKLLQKEWYY